MSGKRLARREEKGRKEGKGRKKGKES